MANFFQAEAQTSGGGAARKHHPSGSLLENLEALIDQQSKQLEAQSKQLEQLGKLVELEAKQIEFQSKQMELQTKQVEALDGKLGHAFQMLETIAAARASAPPIPRAEAAMPAPAAEPTIPAATPVVETSSSNAGTPAALAAEPAMDPNAPTHVVKKGENLTSIARRANTTIAELLKLNKIEDERKLQIGQVLILPKPTTTSSSSQPN